LRHFVSRRIRRKGQEKAFAYEKSAIFSAVLIVAFVFVLGALADPQTGRIENQRAAWLALIGLPVAVAVVFYIEYKVHKKHSAKC
jgi:hypothetical protein